MIETLTQQLIRIALSHGFRAAVDCTGAVLVEIPHIHLETRETGTTVFLVRDLRQLKIALGY
jgi:hypothetical protein